MAIKPKGTKKNPVITVAILEDNEPMLKGMCMELDIPDIHVCSAQDNFEKFLDDVRQCRPTVALVDLRIRTPDTSVGYEAIQSIRDISPQTHCIIYTVFDDLEHFHRGINLGVKAFVSKHINETSLERVIRIVADGGEYYGDLMARYLQKIKELPSMPNLGEPTTSSQGQLSDREREVLRLFGDDHSEEEIAKELNLSIHTVKAHTKNIRGKLNVSSTKEAVRLARLRGWL